MAINYKDRTHTSKGKAGKTPHTGGGKPHSGATKNRLRKSLEEREARLAARKMNKNSSVPKPKRKPPVPKVPTIKANPGPAKRRPTMKEQRDAGASVMVDYDQLNKMAGGGMTGGQKKLDANKDGMISKVDFEMMGANRKQYGGKVSYKMAGGQVVANCYD